VIEIEYIVKDKQVVERLRTADKKEADAYDKALEVADRLAQLLRDDQVVPNLADEDLEELTIYLARNARTVERVLKGKEAESGARGKSGADSEERGAGQKDDEKTATSPERPASASVHQLKATG
jgi:dsDNA-binding SOS-regulon protein